MAMDWAAEEDRYQAEYRGEDRDWDRAGYAEALAEEREAELRRHLAPWQTPRTPSLREALVALRGCFADDGTLLILPHASQFEGVEHWWEAQSIFEACRRALEATS